MMMNKEECLKTLDILREQHKYLALNFNANYPYTIEMLEKVQSCFDSLIKEYFELKEENERTVEAFDKACEQLEKQTIELNDATGNIIEVYKEEWKELFLKEAQEDEN